MKKLSTATDTKDISLTIYNGGFGAIKEKRKVNLTGAETELVFADVAQQIETEYGGSDLTVEPSEFYTYVAET